MIEFDRMTVTYPDASTPTLRDVTFTVPEGELCLVVGRTGSGKSTLLGAVNGLVPTFTGGVLAGRVRVDGRDTRTHHPRDLADVVGVVGQDPMAGFVTDTVAEELAYGMEQLALPTATMRTRVEEIIDVLGLDELRDRALFELSGGQQQRVAIGSVLATHPKVLVLDEPTSALDPTAAEEVLATITRLVHDLGMTVVVAEHRLERVVQYADAVALLPGDGSVRYGPPVEVLAEATVSPPVVELGRLAGWHPPALSVRDARRLAEPLRARLAGVPTPSRRASVEVPPVPDPAPAAELLHARRIVVRYGAVVAVAGVDLDLAAGDITALMGRNGSGKSSLLWALQGSGPRRSGTVDVGGADPGTLSARAGRARVGLVPQTPSDLLYLDSVAGECAQADAESGAEPGAARALLDRLAPGIDDASHPRDLSEGQQLALVLAIQLVAAPQVVLLDEPTRGLDYAAKAELSTILDGLAADGRTVVVATHDVEFVAHASDRVVVMAQGEVVADGPTAEVVVASPAFAPAGRQDPQPVAVPDGGPGSPCPGDADLGAGHRGGAVNRRNGTVPPASVVAEADEPRASASREAATSSAATRGRRDPTVIPLGPRTRAALALATVLGLVAFLWPFVVPAGTIGDPALAPLLFGVLLVLVLVVLVAQISEGGIDAKALALLGVLSAVNAGLRPLSAGTAGIELMFFLLVIAGRAYGPGFGFTLGCTSVFASAIITGGVGPWLPYQMFGAAFVGLFAGMLPRCRGRVEIVLLATYGFVSAYLYGFLLNLSFWPFTVDPSSSAAYLPGASTITNLHRYLVFDTLTSFGWDTGRALTNLVCILLAGPAVLAALRRAGRRAAFEAPVEFADPVAASPS